MRFDPSESAVSESPAPRPAVQDLTFSPAATPEDLLAFRTLNEEWIGLHFALEDTDRQQLGDPAGKIVRPGGQVYMARLGDRTVGCVALKVMGTGEFEVCKMAVDPEVRGQGIGRRLLEYAVAQARGLGARRLYLESSTRLGPAVHLYERLGFRHLRPEERPVTPYSRADVFMERLL